MVLKVRKLIDSFNYAIEGIVYSLKTQRNMRIHMVATLLVLIACFFCRVTKTEFLIIIITITLVISSELINTAIEAAIDTTIDFYHPLAKVSKDVAAAAVLVTAINAVVVGYIVFFDKLKTIIFNVFN